jgi:hypothetical protein
VILPEEGDAFTVRRGTNSFEQLPAASPAAALASFRKILYA